ncbi:MAG: zinc-binding dehydrogenase [Lentisphaerae bacterium]|nr:zinc-binding dehydrogenase [Lentisphaerota bacterium]
MKEVVLAGLRQMEVRETADPKIAGPHDVLLKVATIGVCGSDVHYYSTGRIGSQVVSYPFRVGHELSAVVEETGKAVTRVRRGDLVAVDPAMPCWKCDQCLAGRSHTCRSLKFLGCPGQAQGCLCERVVMPETSCFPVAPGVTAEQAALCEPLSIGVYAASLSGVAPSARVAILGSGPIGLSVLLAARDAGLQRVYVTDRIEGRLAAARGAGATWAGNPDTDDVVGAITALEPGGLDAVFECCGKQEAVDQAAAMLKPGGVMVLVGIPTEDRISFPMDTMRRRELRVQNVRRQNECMEPAIDMIAGHRVSADFMVTHRFTLDETEAAFDLVENYRDGVVKAMIVLPF